MGIKFPSGGGLTGHDLFSKITSLENLFLAWHEFKRGKQKKPDVLQFGLDLEENIFSLSHCLVSGTYHHGAYQEFFIHDPKRRHIHKASVRDRLLHHAVFRILEPIFDPAFIFDSYSSRKKKGVHRAVTRFHRLAWRLSRNNTKAVWVLKCDIRKFFDSVDHQILLNLLSIKIKDEQTLHLLKRVIDSYKTAENKSIPLGNLTSQLFANIYLDYFDRFVKRKLRVKNYLRYADDFIILSESEGFLTSLIPVLQIFLADKLKLEINRGKISIVKWHQGVDFLGYVHFPFHRILRTKTKRRVIARLQRNKNPQSLSSCLGMLKHCSGHEVEKTFWGTFTSSATTAKKRLFQGVIMPIDF